MLNFDFNAQHPRIDAFDAATNKTEIYSRDPTTTLLPNY